MKRITLADYVPVAFTNDPTDTIPNALFMRAIIVYASIYQDRTIRVARRAPGARSTSSLTRAAAAVASAAACAATSLCLADRRSELWRLVSNLLYFPGQQTPRLQNPPNRPSMRRGGWATRGRRRLAQEKQERL